MSRYQEFLRRFQFDVAREGMVGVERECFLMNSLGEISPLAVSVLSSLNGDGRFGYELSACQLEDRIGPCQIVDLRAGIEENEVLIKRAEKVLGFSRLFCEVGPYDMPLDIYPDPKGRYQRIIQGMTQEALLSACRVIGTHVHIGMRDHETALAIYNEVIKHCQRLCEMGDGSNGKRLSIYKVTAKDNQPRPYESWEDFYAYALANGFEKDPRNCWHLIRLSVHGTIEFRMFGATSDIDNIVSWTKICHQLCQDALG